MKPSIVYWVLTILLEISTFISFFYFKYYFPLLAVMFIAMLIIAEFSSSRGN
jgi:hypothetical protein